MKKIFAGLLALLIAVLSLPSAAFASASQEWTNDNAVVVTIRDEYVDAVRSDPSAAFADLDPVGVYVQEFGSWGGKSLDLLLVLPESGAGAQDAAIEALTADARVASAKKCTGAPYESINTLALTADKTTVPVGETVTITPSGELDIYMPMYSDMDLFVIPTDFDPEKDYTPADFPQIDCREVAEIGDYLIPILKNPDYFDLIHAIDALAASPDIEAAWYCPTPAAIAPAEFCTVSDTSVAQFANTKAEDYADGELVGAANDNGEYILRGLKPGTVTVTYFVYRYPGDPYTASIEITVIEEDVKQALYTWATDGRNEPPAKDTYRFELAAEDAAGEWGIYHVYSTDEAFADAITEVRIGNCVLTASSSNMRLALCTMDGGKVTDVYTLQEAYDAEIISDADLLQIKDPCRSISSVVQIGDINHDGQIDVADILLLKNAIMQGEQAFRSGLCRTDCDVNGDSLVDVGDIMLLKTKIMQA